MKKLCPVCHTEMLERTNVHICPRNDIGDCSYDALNLVQEDSTFVLDQTRIFSELRSCRKSLEMHE